MKPLDDAKFSGTKDVDERLKIDSANLQPWIDEYVPNAGKIKAIEQFKGGQSNPTYKIITESKNLYFKINSIIQYQLITILKSAMNSSVLCSTFHIS